MTSADIGIAIRIYRARNNISQREFGARVGIGGPAISLIEQGLRNPTLDTLNGIAHACGMRLVAFLQMVEKIRDEG